MWWNKAWVAWFIARGFILIKYSHTFCLEASLRVLNPLLCLDSNERNSTKTTLDYLSGVKYNWKNAIVLVAFVALCQVSLNLHFHGFHDIFTTRLYMLKNGGNLIAKLKSCCLLKGSSIIDVTQLKTLFNAPSLHRHTFY